MSSTYERVDGREDGIEGEHFGRRDVSMGSHVTGSGAAGGRVVKHDLSGARVDVQHGAVAAVRRTDTQHDVHLIQSAIIHHQRRCLSSTHHLYTLSDIVVYSKIVQ